MKTGEGRKVKALQALVPDVNALEAETVALSDDALAAIETRYLAEMAQLHAWLAGKL